MTDQLIPVSDDPDTGGFYEAAAHGKLTVRRCNGCDSVLHMPRAYCRHCGSWEGRWQPVNGNAKLYSWTVVEHQVHPLYPTPYTVILVELDDLPSVRFVGYLPGRPDVRVGQPVSVDFVEVGDVTIPRWRLTDGG